MKAKAPRNRFSRRHNPRRRRSVKGSWSRRLLAEHLEPRTLLAATQNFINFDPDGPALAFGTRQVGSFDYVQDSLLSDGAQLAVRNYFADLNQDGIPNNNPALSKDYTAFLHASVSTILTSTGNISPTSNGFEITTVVGVRARITNVTVNLATGVASSESVTLADPNNFFEIYFDDFNVDGSVPGDLTLRSDALQGVGYNDGLRILSGIPQAGGGATLNTQQAIPPQDLDQFVNDNYIGVDTIVSAPGSNANLSGLNVSTIDTNFFKDALALIIPQTLTANTFLPFQVDPSNRFVRAPGGAPSSPNNSVGQDIIAQTSPLVDPPPQLLPDGTYTGVGTVNALNGRDTILQTDATLSFKIITPGSIHGFKFEDLNANGTRESGEPAMANVTFELQGDIDGDGDIDTRTTTTDATGQFKFIDLFPNDIFDAQVPPTINPNNVLDPGATLYTVREIVPAGFLPTTPPLSRQFIVSAGEELVWQTGAAALPPGAPQTETVVGTQLMWGNVRPQARIRITPNDVNPVLETHRFTVTVEAIDDLVDNDGQNGLFDVQAGETVSVSLDGQNGAIPDVSATSTPPASQNPAAADPTVIPNLVTDANGQVWVEFTSATAGLVVGTASSNVGIPGSTPIAVTTNNENGSSGPATKRFVDVNITITPNDLNGVNDPHTFTATVMKDDGLLAAQGGDGVTGFTAAVGALVDITLDGQNGAIPDVSATSTPPASQNPAAADPTVIQNLVANASGQVTVTFTSATAGLVIGNASADVSFARLSTELPPLGLPTPNPVVVTRDTDPATAAIPAGPNGSGPATKRFVDVNITITPNDLNGVNDPHTFTATVMQDDGLLAAQGGDGVTGFTAAVGALVDITLDGQNGAIPDVSATSTPPASQNPAAADPTVIQNLVANASGQVTVTFTSATAGLVIGNASADVSFARLSTELPPLGLPTPNPVVVTRDTDPATAAIPAGPNGSGPATKRFVDVNITITPNDLNGVNDPHTFTATVMQDDGLLAAQGGDGVTGFTAAVGALVDITLDGQNGAIPDVSATSTPPASQNPAAADPTVIQNLVANASGQVTVTFTSATAGLVIGNASADVSFARLSTELPPLGLPTPNPVVVTRDTDPATAAIPAGPNGSGPATKRFVDVNITITPPDVNEVGQTHRFTATVMKDDGLLAAQGGDGVTGFTAAVGALVDINLDGRNGATPDVSATSTPPASQNPGPADPTNILDLVTDANGQVWVEFTSATAGLVDGNASADVSFARLSTELPPLGLPTPNPVVVTRDTDPATANIGAGPGGSGPVTKTFVDAYIEIEPDAVNPVNAPHTFIVKVYANNGDGTGFHLVTGTTTPVTETLTASLGASITPIAPPPDSTVGTPITSAVYNLNTDTAFFPGVEFTSPTAGLVTGHASTIVTIDVDGAAGPLPAVILVRETDGLQTVPGSGAFNSDDAVKEFEGGEGGLTPGFWKGNAEHASDRPDKFAFDPDRTPDGNGPLPADPNDPLAWHITGIRPTTKFSAVCTDVHFPGDPTFVQMLNSNGGGVNALMRHTAAAFLNAAHDEARVDLGLEPCINYAFGTEEICELVEAALLDGSAGAINDLKNQFAENNEKGADLDQFGRCAEDAAAAMVTRASSISALSGSDVAPKTKASMNAASAAPAETAGVTVVSAGLALPPVSSGASMATGSSVEAAVDVAFESVDEGLLNLLLSSQLDDEEELDALAEDQTQASDEAELESIGSLDEVFDLLSVA